MPTTQQADGSEQSVSEAAAPDSNSQLDARLDRVEAAVDRLAAAVSKVLPGSHAEAEERTEERLDRPSSIADQVEAELAKRDREAAASRRDEEHESMKATLAKMQETAPAPPVPRRQKLLGWPA